MEHLKFKQTKTELHTHLMGMLSARKFLKILSKYSDYIYWPINKTEDNNSRYIPTSYLLLSKRAVEAISIPLGQNRPYDEGLRDLYRNRSELLSFVIQKFATSHNIDVRVAQQIVYNDYFNSCLKELIAMGVKYTEISFANEDIIQHLKVDEKLSKEIKYTFLLCTQRTNTVGPSMQEKIKRAYENNIAVGFDFMGMETPIDDDELKKNGRKSFYKKLNSVLEVLTNYPDSVLRIHSGEAIGTEENSEKLFKIIDEIKKDNGYKDFPPPELRIGHAIHYNKTEYYYNFLKKNNAIIEINATSNIALSNINSLSDIPYIDYLEHGIPIALSTDGHGAYSTKIILEDKLAYLQYLKSKIPELYSEIIEWENDYLDKKVNRW